MTTTPTQKTLPRRTPCLTRIVKRGRQMYTVELTRFGARVRVVPLQN